MIFENVMIDLETMGTSPEAPIVALAAVAFDIEAGAKGPHFYQRIDLESAVECGAVMQADAVIWWLKQSDVARNELTQGGNQITRALLDFAKWMRTHASESVCVWGCGANFDNVILRRAYERANIEAPWQWWNDRCYRTLKSLHRDIPAEGNGEKHHALADAEFQTSHLLRILARPAEVVA